MTNMRTGGSSSTPLARPLIQRSNQRRRNSKKSAARLPSTGAAGPNSTSPAWLNERSPWVHVARIGIVPARQMHDRHIGAAVGKPEGADAAGAPRLAQQPSERVATVLRLAQIFREMSARMIASATVLLIG